MHFRNFVRKACLAVLCVSFLMSGMGVDVLAQQTSGVAEILITGNQNISDEAIRAVVINLKPGGEFSQENLEKDRQAINNLGYFSNVTARTETTPAGVRVVFDVVEYPLIKEIRIVGNRSISTERLMSLLRSKPGQVFNEQTLALDVEAIQKEYADQAYFAYVSEDIGIDPQTGVLTIPILESIAENIDIVGNKKTADYVFLREMKTKPGVVLNRKTLEEDIRKIYSLGILDPAAYQRPQIEPGQETGKVSVIIPVTEMKTGQASVGLGYGSRQKLVGRVELTEANFRGRAQKVNLLVEVGSQRSDTTRGGNSYQLSYFEPWLDQKNTSMNVSLFNKLVYRFSSNITSTSTTYSERRKGASLGFSRPLNSVTRLSTNFRAEDVGISLPDTLLPNTFESQISQPGPVRSAAFIGTRNTRDYDADPATGGYNSVSVEIGHASKSRFIGERVPRRDRENNVITDDDGNPILRTDWSEVSAGSGVFQKAQFDLRRYISRGGAKVTPEDKRRTLALRLTGGMATGTVLFSEQFFIGGAETLRGYREDRFWGNRMLLLSSEYRVPMGKSLTGVLFADYGDAWKQEDPTIDPPGDLTQHNSFDPRLGIGLGIRVITPIGPLRLDYGIGDDGARTHFSIGHAF